MADKQLILVDGSSYLYRAFHALPPLVNSRGEPTGAVKGVTAMLKRLMEDQPGALFAVVFDAPGKTFRDEIYDQYKAHRPPMPDELVAQIEPLHALVRALGIPLFLVPGVEADDVIGTLATRATAAGMSTLISTGDKDMAQLVNDRVTLINTMNDSRLDPGGVERKFGVRPDQIIDFLALVGDTSDNIPGVPKVGPKTAAKWLSVHGTLDNLLAAAQTIKGKVGENLRACRDQLPMSRELATIRCDVELDRDPADLTLQPPDLDALRELYTRLEFRAWLKELDTPGESGQVTNPEKVEPRYETVLTRDALEKWLVRLSMAELFAFDTETTSLDYMQAEVVGVSFAVTPHEAAYVPLAHDYPGAPAQLDRGEVLERMRPLLEDPSRAKLGQHLKYDMNVLVNHGIALDGVRHDSMLESYVLDSVATRHDMDSLARKYLNEETIHFEDVAGKGAKQVTFNQVEIERAAPYAAEDADITLRLHQALWPRLKERPEQRKLYQELEIPLIPVLSAMERNGVLVDTNMLARQGKELARRLVEIEQQAHDLAGGAFNLGSPKQIQEILYEKMQLPVLRKTPKGQPSTSESVLQELAPDYPLPGLILEYRALSKLMSTYIERLPAQVCPHTGRVHTSYHQAVAATGRLSSSDPNLQNIPVRGEEGRRIRKAFVAAPGYILAAFDYSQIELRIMAHLSGDPGLLEAFAQGQDIHRATAAEVFGVLPLEVSDEQRRSAKAINFGLIYGMSAFGLARQLGIDRTSAQAYVDRYFERYPGVRAFMDETRAKARQDGYVETVYGRRLYLPEIRARNAQRRQYAERTAINAPMQGTAADIIKRAMLAIHAWLGRGAVDAKMIMQVHDELVFEVDDSGLEALVQAVNGYMAGAAELRVPLVVDWGTGPSWDEAHR